MGSLDILAERHRRRLERENEGEATTLLRAGNIAPTAISRVRSRLPTLDRATGGGFARGAVYMVHGAPGSGKSTLIGQAAAAIPGSVYISSEESAAQVASRFVRLGNRDQLVGSEKRIDAALRAAGSAPFVVIDSVSTMKPGIMAAGEAMVDHARRTGAAVVTICHETKIGQHAGPRQLEHLIDCTLGLIVEPTRRLLTVEKNRFGPSPLAFELFMGPNGF